VRLVRAVVDDTGDVHYGAFISVGSVEVYVPANSTNTPASLAELDRRYQAGEIPLSATLRIADITPRSLRRRLRGCRIPGRRVLP